ncbi:MAG: DUF1576 domain-containing protein [Candidatus Aegiribacteria sp.]|nr:DUF1576 domain-containing protein [Candidatus Aegiribacteria sp.]
MNEEETVIVGQNRTLLFLLIFIIFSFIITGIAADGASRAFSGFLELQFQPARLISDFISGSGIGASLINAAAVGTTGLIFIALSRVQLSGSTFSAIFTMMGFALFGKTPMNIIPIIIGVYLSGKLVGKSLSEYILIALFGTALGPLISLVAFELGLSGLPAIAVGTAAGITTGFLIPAIAVSMLHFHQGYNLYNLGLSCGFFALFAAALIRAGGHTFEGLLLWHTEGSAILTFMIPVLSFILILTGLLSGGRKSLKDFMAIQRHSGRLPSDFMDMESMEGALINAGLIGLAGSLYILMIGGDFNGPTIGGLLTIMGFGAFGTHLRNSWPVVLGVIAATLLFGKSLTAPGAILAAIFCTTLAPLAGAFGILTGLTAGFVHLILVHQTGSWQGGMNLYNNGFAGGLTAAFIVSVIAWYRSKDSDFKKTIRNRE